MVPAAQGAGLAGKAGPPVHKGLHRACRVCLTCATSCEETGNQAEAPGPTSRAEVPPPELPPHLPRSWGPAEDQPPAGLPLLVGLS